MRTVIAILALTILAVAPATASSVPGHHAKGVHGASSYAPGHVKKRAGYQSARSFSHGHSKY
jgi:Spy/CpxP family protein refolding chaperone